MSRLRTPTGQRISEPDQDMIDEVGKVMRQMLPEAVEMAVADSSNNGEEEFEIVARTAVTRRRRSPGRANVAGPTKDAPIFVWGMQSSIPRNGGQYIQYEVRLNNDGSTSCNCPGWIFKKKDDVRGCKHTRHVEEEAKDFFARHNNGEQLPTTPPSEEQAERLKNTRGVKADAPPVFGRYVDLD